MKHANDTVIMFVRAPQRGMVKTRLAATIGDEAAVTLYSCFVQDMLRMISKVRYPVSIFFYPAGSGKMVAPWLGDVVSLYPQHGRNLGERMKNAFKNIFSRGISRAVLIGSDMPDLPERVIDDAFTALEGNDAVIGPTLDGGYYLIGFRSDSLLTDIFDRMPWSTPAVFDRTMRTSDRSGYRVHTLPTRRDIDTFDDLAAFFHDKIADPVKVPATIQYILSSLHDIFAGYRETDEELRNA